MCFSAGASFTAGVLLTFVGVETIKKVHKPSQAVFAGITIFFALQQFTEGVLWTAMTHTGYAGLQAVFTYVFLVMAQMIWPVMIPLSVLLMEKNAMRKKILTVLLAVGAAAAAYYLYGLVFHHAYADIRGRHISYESSGTDSFGVTAVIVYLAAVIIPLFVSSIKRVYVLGIIMAISFVVSAVFYKQCLTSVWCFFAAVMSFIIFYIIRDSHIKFHHKKKYKTQEPKKETVDWRNKWAGLLKY
jgi:hypothetical protein